MTALFSNFWTMLIVSIALVLFIHFVMFKLLTNKLIAIDKDRGAKRLAAEAEAAEAEAKAAPADGADDDAAEELANFGAGGRRR